jgi:hypothetical protein
MAKVGIVLNLVGALVIAVVVYTLGSMVFHIDPSVLPDWAIPLTSSL